MNSASSGGVVRRRTAAEASSDYNGSSTSTSNNDHNDNFKDDADDENMEETSDKETRLTLMEEVLLLGLKDKEVSFCKKNTTCASLAFRNEYLQTMRFNENRESETWRWFFGKKAGKKRRRWWHLALFSIYTHTLSTNVVDVYIRNRLNDVWTSDSWKRSFDNHENLMLLLDVNVIVVRMKGEKAKNYHGLWVVHLQIPIVVNLRCYFFFMSDEKLIFHQKRQLGQSDLLKGSGTSCYLSFSHTNCVIKRKFPKQKSFWQVISSALFVTR